MKLGPGAHSIFLTSAGFTNSISKMLGGANERSKEKDSASGNLIIHRPEKILATSYSHGTRCRL